MLAWFAAPAMKIPRRYFITRVKPIYLSIFVCQRLRNEAVDIICHGTRNEADDIKEWTERNAAATTRYSNKACPREFLVGQGKGPRIPDARTIHQVNGPYLFGVVHRQQEE